MIVLCPSLEYKVWLQHASQGSGLWKHFCVLKKNKTKPRTLSLSLLSAVPLCLEKDGVCLSVFTLPIISGSLRTPGRQEKSSSGQTHASRRVYGKEGLGSVPSEWSMLVTQLVRARSRCSLNHPKCIHLHISYAEVREQFWF